MLMQSATALQSTIRGKLLLSFRSSSLVVACLGHSKRLAYRSDIPTVDVSESVDKSSTFTSSNSLLYKVTASHGYLT